ncbi:MAG: putative sugar nucleotidyl transferase, partial [Kaistella sp.]
EGQKLVQGDVLIAYNGKGKKLTTVEFAGDFLQVKNVWDIFQKNGEAIKSDFDLLTKGRKSVSLSKSVTVIGKRNLIFLEKGAKAEACILNTNSGPIYLDKDSEIIQQHHEELNAKTYFNKIKDLTQDLPFERGIIYFQNAEGKIIFFDFVDDLSKFAKMVFNAKSKRWKQLQDDVIQIHYDLTGNDILAKLMMKTKGLRKRENHPFGLYHKNGKYFVEKIASQKEEKPILKFCSFTQGLKAVSFIKTQEKYADVNELTKTVNLKNRTEMWLSAGRTLGEKSFVIFEKGKLTAYGFYELHTQINTWKKISALKIDLDTSTVDLQNDLKLALLREDFEIQPLPK